LSDKLNPLKTDKSKLTDSQIKEIAEYKMQVNDPTKHLTGLKEKINEMKLQLANLKFTESEQAKLSSELDFSLSSINELQEKLKPIMDFEIPEHLASQFPSSSSDDPNDNSKKRKA